MFSQHVSQKLSPYCHGELPDEESRRVAEHLIGCQRCRQEFEEIKLGVKFAEQLPRVSAPASLWSEIEAAYEKASQETRSDEKLARAAFAFRWQHAAAACAALLLAVGAIWFFAHGANSSQVVKNDQQQSQINTQANDTGEKKPEVAGNPTPEKQNEKPEQVTAPPQRTTTATWEVARLEGAPTVGTERIEAQGQLSVGQWLETDSTSRAQLNVANIGRVEIEPNSRVRLVETCSTGHKLALALGQLHATINAPPRLFIVETPSAVAVDLGCSYTLKVDKAGRSILRVTGGWVALELRGRESIVPAGAVCVTEKGKGPGTPYFDDSSQKFQAALSKLDFQNGGMAALNVVLQEAREYDTLTLWHLLARVRGVEREKVYERMAALIPPPAGVTKEGVMKLDKGMLDLWKKGLEWAWFE
jgi:anti-sigma factor RsiW